jgi:aerobic-type carbon monoxide dehydrogenase small subunit (CoxS/CutS family)
VARGSWRDARGGVVKVRFQLNGAAVEVDVRADENLLTVLRGELGVLSVRETCGIGVCGACTALLDGEPISTCLVLAPLADGASIATAEGLDPDHRVRHAFADTQAFQCGFCTPGMALTAAAFLEENPSPSDEEIKLALAGNLCRCGCYVKILDAVRRAATA